MLSEKKLPAKGTFSIRNLHEKMQAASNLFLESDAPSGVQLKLEREKFLVSFPGDCSIYSGKRKIWAQSRESEARVSLSWVKPPRELAIIYPNQQRLQFDLEKSPFQFSLAQMVGIFLLLAFCFHMGVIAFSAISIKLASKKENSRKVLSVAFDVPQMNSTRPTSDVNSSNASAVKQMASAKKLLDSWGVGKPIKDANQVLKPSRFVNAFRQQDSTSTKFATWSLDKKDVQTSRDNPLNITDSQIAEALRPAYTKLKECYDDALLQEKTLRGKPELLIDISTDGTVSSIDIRQLNASSSTLAQLKRCFADAYRNVQLSSKPNQDFSVKHTLVLDY
ncbi:MAG: hypothetical protein J0L93_11280 [Deltaproteobacteria bacterium]|nr:hypothetical protein [Deltaproteobacteria bacterium]